MATNLLQYGIKATNNSTIFPAAAPQTGLARNVDDFAGPGTFSFNGQLADGSYLPAGNYSMIVRALKIFGNRTNLRDYDTVRTVNFGLTYAPPAAN
jgi:hypothetical protein